MDAFESLIASFLEKDGFWVRSSVKVALTKEEKRAIGRHSAPRWELDLVGYSGAKHEVRVIECKSFLDSRGVVASDLLPTGKYAKRYKLFTDHVLRPVVLRRLELELVESGFCPAAPRIILGMAAGRVCSAADLATLRELFQTQGWLLFDPEWIQQQLRILSAGGYENSVAAVVAKLLLRPPRASRRATF